MCEDFHEKSIARHYSHPCPCAITFAGIITNHNQTKHKTIDLPRILASKGYYQYSLLQYSKSVL